MQYHVKNENPNKDISGVIISNEVIVELKAVEVLHSIYKAQLLTHLRAMDKRVGLLLNFNVEKLKDGSTPDHLRGHRGEVRYYCVT